MLILETSFYLEEVELIALLMTRAGVGWYSVLCKKRVKLSFLN